MPRTEHAVPEAAVEMQYTKCPNVLICSFWYTQPNAAKAFLLPVHTNKIHCFVS